MVTVQVPDGDRKVPVLMTFTVPGMKQAGTIRMPRFEVPLDYRWVSNTRLVIEKGTERGSIDAPVSNGEVLAMDLDGSHQEYLYGHDMFRSSKRGERYGDDYGYGDIEGFLRFFEERCQRQGLFIFDEPESALSPVRQIEFLKLLQMMDKSDRIQVIMATHSPLLMAYPNATLLRLSKYGLEPTTVESTDHYKTLREFFEDPRGFVEAAIGE